jgi:hypothetical protein
MDFCVSSSNDFSENRDSVVLVTFGKYSSRMPVAFWIHFASPRAIRVFVPILVSLNTSPGIANTSLP